MERETEVPHKWQRLRLALNERERRLWAAAEAQEIGAGGISVVARATGLARSTIHRGIREKPDPSDRMRRAGAGRKPLRDTNKRLVEALDLLVEPSTRGDPMCPLRWCSKSTAHLADALKTMGFKISPPTVWRMLKKLGYTLQRTRKTTEGSNHPDRNAQFEKISRLVRAYLGRGEPVVSVDTKKKEVIGNFANQGDEWQPKGHPEEVNTHDFPDKNLGKAIPYGVYDIARNKGYVSVGVTHDTPEFAVAALRRWWSEIGKPTYPKAKRLLITADCGGSNGYRVRAWKAELQRFARDAALDIRVAHFPPGTSKWNKIEHRMFCHITHNWRGRPLVSREVIISLIGSVESAKGLRICAELDDATYDTGVKVSKEEFSAINLRRDGFHGDWNYVICMKCSV